jgi:hypothetical protein
VAQLAVADIIPQERREQFLIQVFWNAHDIITVNTKVRHVFSSSLYARLLLEGEMLIRLFCSYETR